MSLLTRLMEPTAAALQLAQLITDAGKQESARLVLADRFEELKQYHLAMIYRSGWSFVEWLMLPRPPCSFCVRRVSGSGGDILATAVIRIYAENRQPLQHVWAATTAADIIKRLQHDCDQLAGNKRATFQLYAVLPESSTTSQAQERWLIRCEPNRTHEQVLLKQKPKPRRAAKEKQ